MISAATLLRPPKPASQEGVQRARGASAKGADHGRLTKAQAAMSGGPSVQRLERAASALSGTASAAPVQMLKDKKARSVDISKLSDDLLLRLAAAAVEGETVPGYTFEEGDVEALKEENRRRSVQNRKKRKTSEEPSTDSEDEKEVDPNSAEEDSGSDENYAMDSDEEAINYLTTEGRRKAGLDKIRYDKDGEEKELKDWPQTGLQGALGEYEAHRTMTKQGHAPTDLNVLALNFKGLDHISAHPQKPLEQTKLHLSESTATKDTYLGHVKKAPMYAVKAVQDLKRHEATFKELLKLPAYSANEPLKKLVKALGKLEGKSQDDIEDSEVHKLVTGSMQFSVPSDIFDKIDPADQKHFTRMSWSVSRFQNIMDAMSEDYVPSKPRGSKVNPDDEAFDPEKGK